MPINRLNAVLRELDRQEKAKAYFNSISVARLARIVVSAAGGAEAARSFKEEVMLPFRAEDIIGQKPKEDCKPRTLRAIQRLINNGKIPMNLMATLQEEIAALGSLD